ncbi:MAG: SGNH/GDSL hydrolase family protein [Pseudomonadota bacterium]|nr:SGNH/GDSL hydrolase family protein [Pseudomonadota bacterium]
MKKAAKLIIVNLVVLLILLAVLEGLLLLLVRNPEILKRCPRRIGNMIGYLYVRERPTIQFEAACARHDPVLGYTLKPGSCAFGGREFTNRYDINSLGVRDSEAALDHPEIIVAGDSFAMGWGVEQDETYASLLRRRTGLKVLNAAVSSYGTVRELGILRSVLRDRLRYLIIQYCGNDLEENREFYLENRRLPVMSAEKYEEYREIYRKSQRYYPGKYLWMKIGKRWEEMEAKRRRDQGPRLDRDEIDLFLYALQNSGLDLDRTTLIVFVMNGRNPEDNREFPAALRRKLAAGDYPSYLKDMRVLDFSGRLGPEHFHVLDDHLNAAGHAVIAAELARVIAGGR